MGFLSRKSKFTSPPVEEHPIVEELEEMEAAVPEPGADRPAGPVAEQDQGDSPAGPVPDDGGALRAGHGPSSTPPSSVPPAGDAEVKDGSAPSTPVFEAEQVEPGRFMPKDLL